MEQFSLEKWLKDKSRKVVTRDGREVEIFYYNADKTLLVGRISPTEIHQYTKDGFQYETMCQAKNDLFFADEENGLTKFEKTMIQFSHERNSLIQFEHTKEEINAHLYRYSEKLLDLARKEIEKDNVIIDKDKYLKICDQYYNNGKKDALKDLPKWKDVSGKNGAGTKDYKIVGYYLVKGNYAIYLENLEKLPKEE